jgi:hypothetical protein
MSEEEPIKKVLIVNLSKKVSKSKKENSQIKTCVPKEKQKRTIVNTKRWDTCVSQCETQNNMTSILQEIIETLGDDDAVELSATAKLVGSQLNNKISGYKNQDKIKGLYSEGEFIDLKYVIETLIKCELKCYYCKQEMTILYENVRDPLQWSVERIDNKLGHNKGNIETSCLGCNLRRRTIYHERYILTKQLQNIKKV